MTRRVRGACATYQTFVSCFCSSAESFFHSSSPISFLTSSATSLCSSLCAASAADALSVALTPPASFATETPPLRDAMISAARFSPYFFTSTACAVATESTSR